MVRQRMQALATGWEHGRTDSEQHSILSPHSKFLFTIFSGFREKETNIFQSQTVSDLLELPSSWPPPQNYKRVLAQLSSFNKSTSHQKEKNLLRHLDSALMFTATSNPGSSYVFTLSLIGWYKPQHRGG